VLRRIIKLKKVEVAVGLRKLHIEELHNLYSSPRTIIRIRIRMMKSRRIRWTGHVARIWR
jgi:hypothetical protein